MEVLELLAVLLIVFNIVLLGTIWYLISRKKEQKLLPKTKKDILEKIKTWKY